MKRDTKIETHRMQPSDDWVSGPCSGLRAAKSVSGSARKRIAERDYLWIRAELIKPPIRDSEREEAMRCYTGGRECVCMCKRRARK